MATVKVTYYSGTQEIRYTQQMRNATFKACFPETKGKRVDGYTYLVGINPDTLEIVPVTRVIFFKKHPSLHKCDARCRHAKGSNCECSCGGQFHGAGD